MVATRPAGLHEAVAHDHPARPLVAGGVQHLQPGQAEPAVLLVDERVPQHQADRLGHHAPAPGSGVGPVADLGVLPGLEVVQRDRGQQLVAAGVRDRPAESASGGMRLPAHLQVVQRAVQRVGIRQRQPAPGLRVGAGLPDPLGVLIAVRAQHHPLAAQRGYVVPRAAGGTVLAGEQGAHPGVEQLAALRQERPDRAVEGEAQPPGELPRGPVALVRPPHHGAHLLRVEAPGEQQPQRALHHTAPATPGVRAVGDLGAPGGFGPQRDGSGVPHRCSAVVCGGARVDRVHGERPVPVLAPAGRDDGADELLRVGHRVRHRHRRPLLGQRVLALLERAWCVVGSMCAQRDHAVGQGGNVLGEPHVSHPRAVGESRANPYRGAMDESHRP